MKKLVTILFIILPWTVSFSQQWRGLSFEFVGRDTFLSPYDGANPKAKIRVVNTTSSPSPTRVFFSVSSPQVPNAGGRFASFPNGGYVYLAPFETTYVSCWLRAVYESGPFPTGYFNRDIVFTFRRNFSSDTSTFSISKTYVFNNISQNPQVSGPMTVSGKVIVPTPPPFPPVNILVGTIHERGFSISSTATDSGAQFSTSLPLRDDWYLQVSSDHYKTKFIRIKPGTSSNMRIEMEPQDATPAISFQLLKTVSTSTGFWRGAASESEKTVAFFPGQENWKLNGNCPDSATVAQSRIYKYSFSGQLLWSHATGWDTWGGDMSRDGKYVVYAINTGRAPGCYGPQPAVVLLDGTTGQKVWQRDSLRIYESYEVAISNNANFVAVGTTASGQVSLLERATGRVIWTVPPGEDPDTGFGQVRRLKFDAADQYLYVASGDDQLRTIRVSDGTLLWRAFVWGWAWVNGLNFSPDGSTIVAGTKSGDVTLVRTSDGKVLWSVETGNFEDAVFSPDGKLIATFTGLIIDASTGEVVAVTRFGAPPYFLNDRLVVKLPNSLAVFSATGERVYETSNPPDIGVKPGEQAQWSYLSSDLHAIIAARDMSTPPQTGIAFYQGSVVSSAQAITTAIPRRTELSQNYPNPFNPSTSFEFSVSTFEQVNLKVFDLLGREVATMVDEKLYPGRYKTEWDAGSLPSGVYFYRLRAGAFIETKKLVLIR